ncbi:dTDP-4-dehydrorhamnose reductase [Streptomyces acidiscabies]|uniref:dTDP-4-dehydrorhamnose reductase n=1 Tax=Streptomyces acidiscabies TaxID=42234 RepID=A0AAP6BEI3_9ACTN|nr:dTDP-4-dehydrorhamnose reductase [Streptomyces acidiscabies]MBP5939655.1 dTDP-4-dehydrorhamnose reductase [Streptomyces sp. LBUM 1476]MBZ3910826.1 dTDP-4-dehydrorhamnose reductase [Streptomyces acidiscabies]MDX2962992.1 dTDP-4-dehydrorhamnose reductase [Streptomyces acidiscabies]MDX3017462.1 dTDP-4-dehydrorhamnose reductase [Streptomyces acidiscabies]MDX3787938.1 dTDP-4-dehydrorhamnose reductase [Streptomyces acidiscabies]
MTRWLITGAGGMLGRDLVATLKGEVTALTRADLDITDPAAVRAAVEGHDVVVNAAAWTDVDGAETDEAAATRVNGEAVRVLAEACVPGRTRLIQVSTDYVFPGDATEPYRHDSPTAPLNAYGRGKLVGEDAVKMLLPDSGYVVRTAWLYGAHGRNFVSTMLKLAESRDTVEVVDDQRGQPTWTVALAEQIAALGESQAPAGVYHGTASGTATWFDLARAAYELSGLDPERVRSTTSEKFVRPARRPSYSVLAHDRWDAVGIARQPHWKDQLAQALKVLA